MSVHLKFSLVFIIILSFLTFSCRENDCGMCGTKECTCDYQALVCEICGSNNCCEHIGTKDCCCFSN